MHKILILLFAVFLTACSNSNTTDADITAPIENQATADLPEDFQDFYQQFHADSAYQLSHIQWPLRGVPDRALAEGEVFYFSQDSWTIQRPISKSSGYISQFSSLTEELIIEQIINPTDATSLERRFLKDNDGWKLIYYQGVRKLQ